MEDFAPAWSPDGSKLAFDRHGAGTDVPSVYVMNADGTSVRKLTSDRYEWYPSWSPDGSRITYRGDVPGESPLMLFVVDADGSNKRQLLSPDVPGDMPDWSRDGRIAFSGGTRAASGGTFIAWLDIDTVNPDGSDVRNLTQTDGLISGDLRPVSFATSPRPARAGKRLTATLTLTDRKGVPFEFDLPACRASAGGRALRVVDRGFAGSHVRCVWFVPRSAKGTLLRGRIGAESCGSKLNRSFTRRLAPRV